jgi:hypothetical protein
VVNIPANCEFAQLHEILDKKKCAQVLQRHLGPFFAGRETQVESCSIERFHYKPGADCRIVLEVNLRCCDKHESRRQIYFGQLFHSQEARKVFEASNGKKLAQPEFGPAVVYVPEWEMIMWAYPNDPDLIGLPLMVNSGKILALAQATPEKFGLNQPPVAIAAEMTKYVPGMRCGYIYRMALAASNSHGANSSWAVYGKAYREDDGEKAYAIMKQIWESAACRRGDLVIPQPYSYDSERQILWQEALSGQSFAKIAETIPDLPAVAEEIGGRLAAFHGTRLQLPVEMTFDFQVEKARQAVEAITRTFPEHAKYCAAAGQKLLAAAARLGPGLVTPVHASFKFSHIFATAKGVAFIDFDGANLGDPGHDLGRFIAHLCKMEASGKIAPKTAEQTAANFCASYHRLAASPLPQERIDWFAASHLISSQMYKSVKRMDARALHKLLEIAERLCV